MTDVLKVMALSCGLDWFVSPRAAFKTVTIAVSGTAVCALLRKTGMEETMRKKLT